MMDRRKSKLLSQVMRSSSQGSPNTSTSVVTPVYERGNQTLKKYSTLTEKKSIIRITNTV